MYVFANAANVQIWLCEWCTSSDLTASHTMLVGLARSLLLTDLCFPHGFPKKKRDCWQANKLLAGSCDPYPPGKFSVFLWLVWWGKGGCMGTISHMMATEAVFALIKCHDSCLTNITSSNQRLWECVRCRINVYQIWKADVNVLVLLNMWVYGNWRRHATQSSVN